jgi:hypothetical protein
MVIYFVPQSSLYNLLQGVAPGGHTSVFNLNKIVDYYRENHYVHLSL